MSSRWIWVIGGVAAVGGIGAGVAFAEGEMRGHGWGRHHGHGGGMFRRARTKDDVLARARARFAKFDANSDGTVDQEEIKAQIESRRGRRGGRRGMRRMERMMRRMDLDRDNKVTAEEFLARPSMRFSRRDIDADGAITDADLPPMLRGQGVLSSDAGQGGRGWGRRRMRRMLDRLREANTNGDDRVTLEEVQALAKKRFDRLDANGDGAIDETDRDARRAEMIDYRAKRMLARFGGAGKTEISREDFLADVERRFDRRDLDDDGVLSRDERGGRGWGRRGRGHEGHGWERGGRHHGEGRRYGRHGDDEMRGRGPRMEREAEDGRVDGNDAPGAETDTGTQPDETRFERRGGNRLLQDANWRIER